MNTHENTSLPQTTQSMNACLFYKATVKQLSVAIRAVYDDSLIGAIYAQTSV
jgi:hypothetical protein